MTFDSNKKIGYKINHEDGTIVHEKGGRAWVDWVTDENLSEHHVRETLKRGHLFIKKSVEEQGSLIAELYKSDSNIQETSSSIVFGYEEDKQFYGTRTTMRTTKSTEYIENGERKTKPTVDIHTRHKYKLTEELKVIEEAIAKIFKE